MALPVQINDDIQKFVIRSDFIGLCNWLYQLSLKESVFQYINDPEFAELITKNDTFMLGALSWFLQDNQPPEVTQSLSQFLYLCVCRRLLTSARRIIDFMQIKNPDALVSRLEGTRLAPIDGFPTSTILPNVSLEVTKLLHLYSEVAYLGRWKPEGARAWTYRDEDLASEKNKARVQKHTQWLDLILETIFLLHPQMRPYFSNEHPAQKLIDFYHALAKHNGRYYSDDQSDDSDSEDEDLLKTPQHQSVARRKHLLRKQEITQKQNFNYKTNSGNIRTRSFWQQTKRTSAQKSGLEDKIAATGTVSVKQVEDYIKVLKQDAQQRPMIAAASSTNKKRFIAQIRGLNYMYDRWSNDARRFHYQLDEVGLPQLSESVLKELPFDIYTELSASQNFVGHIYRLSHVANDVHQNYQQLTQTGHMVGRTFTANGSAFLFNHRGDFLQHRYSNGISEHLSSLGVMREQYPELRGILINCYNYGISTGNRPYHAEKYAVGLKEYYPFNFKPYYDMDGRLIHSHAGKIYVILYEREEFLKQETANRVLQSLNQGRTPIKQNIIFELETTFIGMIPGENVVHQEVFKFPSFHKDHKPIYEIKYGLNATLYGKFQHLIRTTRPETPEREKVLELLKEWLCAYYEVLLVRIAEQSAQAQDGVLEYVDHANQRQMRADSSPLTSGGEHLHDRNRLHVLQNLRWEIGTAFLNKKTITQQDVETEIQIILKEPNRLKQVYSPKAGREGVSLPTINTLNQQGIHSPFYAELYDSLVPIKKITEDEAMAQIADKIIQDALAEGLFISKVTTKLNADHASVSTAKPAILAWSLHPHLAQADYLYHDHEINALLRYYLQPLHPPDANPIAAIFAAMHPLVTGPGAVSQRNFFQENLTQALLADQTVVIPINLTPEYVGTHNLPLTAGTHWVGLVVRTDSGQRRIFYVDSLNQPIPVSLRQLIDEARGDITLNEASLLQQGLDVDCGAWTVDNMNRLARAEANTINNVANARAVLRPTGQGAGHMLRMAHNQTYELTLTGAPQLSQTSSLSTLTK